MISKHFEFLIDIRAFWFLIVIRAFWILDWYPSIWFLNWYPNPEHLNQQIFIRAHISFFKLQMVVFLLWVFYFPTILIFHLKNFLYGKSFIAVPVSCWPIPFPHWIIPFDCPFRTSSFLSLSYVQLSVPIVLPAFCPFRTSSFLSLSYFQLSVPIVLPATCRSNLGSNPGILPSIAHKVKTRDGERTLLNPGNKKSLKQKNV